MLALTYQLVSYRVQSRQLLLQSSLCKHSSLSYRSISDDEREVYNVDNRTTATRPSLSLSVLKVISSQDTTRPSGLGSADSVTKSFSTILNSRYASRTTIVTPA